MSRPHFSLVVLCYRSGYSIVPFVKKLRQVLSRCNFTWELILVGNYFEGSTDETPKVVQELADRWSNVSAVIRPKEGMMGWDMRMGLNAAESRDGESRFDKNISRAQRRWHISPADFLYLQWFV
jgi:hypothetical protein